MSEEGPFGCLWCDEEADTYEAISEHMFQAHRNDPLPAQ